MRLIRRLSLLGSAIVALAAFACNDPARPAGEDRAAAAGVIAVPTTAPSIRGVITSVAHQGGSTLADVRGSIRIEAPAPAAPPATGYDKAVVTWDGRTRLARRDGTPATADALAEGVTVSAWFTGPVMESYPVQARARVIVVE